MRDLGWNERLIMVPLIVIIVFLGVYPKPVLDRITPSVNQLLAHVDQVTHTQQPPAATGRIAASSTTNAGTGGQP
jgi:NADH-quinone oxidoreductase subunit M